jgi:hypothetical protein
MTKEKNFLKINLIQKLIFKLKKYKESIKIGLLHDAFTYIKIGFQKFL